MNFEFHYYVTFIISILCGYSYKNAYILSSISQYIDDHKTDIYFTINQKEYILKKTSSLNPLDYLLESQITFMHFIPGDIEKVKRNFQYIYNESELNNVVTPGSRFAIQILYHALLCDDVYVHGIAFHSFVDTWAHQNFSGYLEEVNSFGLFLDRQIGHSEALTLPDSVNSVWYDPRLQNKIIKNNIRFVQSARSITKQILQHTNNKTISKLIKEKVLLLLKLFSLYKTISLENFPIILRQKLRNTNEYENLDYLNLCQKFVSKLFKKIFSISKYESRLEMYSLIIKFLTKKNIPEYSKEDLIDTNYKLHKLYNAINIYNSIIEKIKKSNENLKDTSIKNKKNT